MLGIQKQRLDAKEPVLLHNKSALLLSEWKRELLWLKTDAYSQARQQTLKLLDSALMEAFNSSNSKRFSWYKRKRQKDLLRISQDYWLDQTNSRIYLVGRSKQLNHMFLLN